MNLMGKSKTSMYLSFGDFSIYNHLNLFIHLFYEVKFFFLGPLEPIFGYSSHIMILSILAY